MKRAIHQLTLKSLKVDWVKVERCFRLAACCIAVGWINVRLLRWVRQVQRGRSISAHLMGTREVAIRWRTSDNGGTESFLAPEENVRNERIDFDALRFLLLLVFCNSAEKLMRRNKYSPRGVAQILAPPLPPKKNQKTLIWEWTTP